VPWLTTHRFHPLLPFLWADELGLVQSQGLAVVPPRIWLQLHRFSSQEWRSQVAQVESVESCCNDYLQASIYKARSTLWYSMICEGKEKIRSTRTQSIRKLEVSRLMPFLFTTLGCIFKGAVLFNGNVENFGAAYLSELLANVYSELQNYSRVNRGAFDFAMLSEPHYYRYFPSLLHVTQHSNPGHGSLYICQASFPLLNSEITADRS
jgi:hypothetical protein